MGLKQDFILADIACGYNPLGYVYLPRAPKKYVACDLSTSDMESIQLFFDKFNINGEAKAFDVLSTRFLDYISKRKSYKNNFVE